MRLEKSAAATGKIKAGIDIGPQPPDCQKDTPHAPLVVGNSKLGTLDRERAQLDAANAILRFCADYHKRLRENLKGQP
jgi:hypothetical protein